MTTGTATAAPQVNITLPTRSEQSIYDKHVAKVMVCWPTQISSHCMIFRLDLPGREQFIFSYGYATDQGYFVAWTDIVYAKDHPEIKEVWKNNSFDLLELQCWMGVSPNQAAPKLLLDQEDRALLYEAVR